MSRLRQLGLIMGACALLKSGASAQEARSTNADDDGAQLLTLDLESELRRGQGSLSLAHALRLALSTAPSGEESDASVRQAEAQRAKVRIGFYPHATLNARYTRLLNVKGGRFTARQGNVAPGFFTDLANQPDNAPASAFDQAAAGTLDGIVQRGIVVPVYANRYNLRAEVSYALTDLLLTVLPSYRAAQGTVRAESLRRARARQLVIADTHQAYFDYVGARAELIVAQLTLRQSASQRRDIDAKVEAGSLPEVEGLRAKTQVASAESRVAHARARESSARAALAALLHEALPAEVGIDDSLHVATAQAESVESLIEEAKQKRADVVSALAALAAQADTASARRGAGWPRIMLVAGVDAARPKPWVVPQVDRFGVTGDVSVQLAWSPDQFVDARRQGELVDAERARAAANLRAIKDALTVEVSQAFADYDAAASALTALSASIPAAEENYRIRREQLRAGAAVPRDIIDAQAELEQARLDVLHAALDVKVSHSRLRCAVGRD